MNAAGRRATGPRTEPGLQAAASGAGGANALPAPVSAEAHPAGGRYPRCSMLGLPARRREGLLLGVILAAAFLPRALLCLRYQHVDEYLTIGTVVRMFLMRTVAPVCEYAPGHLAVLTALPTGIWSVVLWAAGAVPSPTDIWPLYRLHSILPLLAIRGTSLLLGTATCGLVYLSGKKTWGRPAGLAAAAVLAASPLHADFSSFARPDAAATFYAAGALHFALAALRSGAVRDFALSGAMAGLAASTKMTHGIVLLPLIAAHALRPAAAGGLRAPLLRIDRAAAAGIGAFAGAFLLGTPAWIFHPVATYRFWSFILYFNSSVGVVGEHGPAYVRLLELLWESDRTILLLFAAGIAAALLRRRREDAVLLAVAVPSVLFFGAQVKKVAHYLLVAYPALALLAGGVFAGFERLPRRTAGAALAALLLLLAWPAARSAATAAAECREDSRWAAQRWVQENVADGSRIVVDWWYIPRLVSPAERGEFLAGGHRSFFLDRYGSDRTYELIDIGFGPDGGRYDPAWLRAVDADVLVTSSGCFDRFFDGSPPPPPGAENRALYEAQRNGYVALLRDPDAAGWALVRRFDTGKGPVVLVFRRRPPSATG